MKLHLILKSILKGLPLFFLFCLEFSFGQKVNSSYNYKVIKASGDIIIDGGNSHYDDTDRRYLYLKNKNIHFIGAGVSGGSKGARFGPSIMPGGDKECYKEIQPIFEAAAANEYYENTKNDAGFKVPKIYWNYTSEEVLTLDWIEGISIRNKSLLEEKKIDVKI